MGEFIFFAVIIFFSIIESIARRRKAKKGGGPVEEVPTGDRTPGEWEFEWEQASPADLPTYDDDLSYDDEATRSGSAPMPAPRGIESQKSSSRTMLPGGLLEELASMAEKLDVERQRMEQAEADAQAETRRQDRERSEQERVSMSRGNPGTVVPATRGPARTVSSRTLHQAHAEYGTDPSERAPSEQDGLDPLERTLSRDAKAVRVQLLSDSASALRQAIILQEVLGPPKALQEDVVETTSSPVTSMHE